MNKTTKFLSFLAAASLLMLSACKANVSRNDDGSINVETTITQQELQDAISAAIADPLISNVTAELGSGYVLVSADHQRLNDASKTDTLSFRLNLSVSNGQLIASISNAQIDGTAIEQNRVDNWNQTLSNRLSKVGQRNENATLQSVSVTPERVSMTWAVTR